MSKNRKGENSQEVEEMDDAKGARKGEIDLNKLEKRLDDIKSAAGLAMTDSRLALTKVDLALENFDDLKTLRPEIEERLEEQQDDVDALKIHLEQIDQQVQEAVKKTEGLKDIEKRIVSSEEKLDKSESRLDKAEADLQELLSKFKSDLQKDVEGLLEELEDIVQRVDTLEKVNTQDVWEKINQAVSDAQGALHTCTEAAQKAVDLKNSYTELSESYDDLLSRADDGKEKMSLAVKLVNQLEEKVRGVNIGVESQVAEEEDIELEFELQDILKVMIAHKASDLHLKPGTPPTVRLEGELVPIGEKALSEAECRKLIFSALNPVQKQRLMAGQEIDFAYEMGEARFRFNVFLQKSTVSAAIRMLLMDIPSFMDLHLPKVLEKLSLLNNGLVLVTGPAGSGKSTTLASMVDYINQNRKLHIITIEDPIEYVHKDKSSLVTQREIGADSQSFKEAMKQSLRQDPNVILIGEMRDPETILTAITAAETGHLVFSTLHTHNTIQAVDRIIDSFPGDQEKQFKQLLATNLRAVISQRLLTRTDGEGRVPAVEVMLITPTIASVIQEGSTKDIYQYIVQGQSDGMQTFTSSLTQLFEAGLISKEEALYRSDQPTEFRFAVEGHNTSAAGAEDSLMTWL